MKAIFVNAAVVGLGGFVGALGRYGLSGLVQRQLALATFPYGTLIVNLLGCIGIGILSGLTESRQLFGPEFRTFALIGVLGGFTTFSTFGYETVVMMRDAEYLHAGMNITAHVVLGLTGVWLGYALAVLR